MATAVSQSNAINIHVFRNGDSHYKGRKFVVNQRQTRNFDSFLSMVTTGVKPPYGAVRKLYTPTNGHKVDDLSRLENNKYYVAAGMERFRRVQYFSIGRPDGAPRQTSILQRSIKPVAHSRIQASAKISKPADGPKTIHVYRNGDTLYPSVRLLLTKRMLSNWDVVLQVVTERVNLVNGAVRKLWHIDGSRVIELSEIENDASYVASGNEKFKKVAYGINGPLDPSSPRIKRPAPPKPKPVISRKPTKITQKVTPPKKVPKKPPQPKPEKKKKKEKTAEQKEAETVIPSKPSIVKRSREKDESDTLDFGENDKSVFKAKEGRKETKGAAEVQDSKDTAIDLPIDQIAAEEVEEEVAPSQDVDPGEDTNRKDEDTYREEDTIPRENTYDNTFANSFSESKEEVVHDKPDNSFSGFQENTQDLFEETPADNKFGTVADEDDQKREEAEPATRSGYEVVEEETEKNADKDRTTPTEEQGYNGYKGRSSSKNQRGPGFNYPSPSGSFKQLSQENTNNNNFIDGDVKKRKSERKTDTPVPRELRYSSQSVNSGGFVNDGRKEAFSESNPKLEQSERDIDRRDEAGHIQDDSAEVEEEEIIESVPIPGGGEDEDEEANKNKKDEDKEIQLEDQLKEEGDEVIIEDVPILGEGVSGVQEDAGEHLTFAVDYGNVTVTDSQQPGEHLPPDNAQDSLAANDTSEIKADSP